MIRFLQNQTLVTLEETDPNTTVLNWLRETARRSGTKEGCASGDCGACTVALGRVEAGRMRYETANSCLLLVSQLNGKQLLTVEDMAHNGALHPVQQHFADNHASQCGFCTPGFVMSAFALQKSGAGSDRRTVEQHLGGNLCRCTGYRPIIEAAQRACALSEPDIFTQQEAQTVARLQALASHATDELAWRNRVLAPKTVDELASLYQRYPQARLLAGGTDLALAITQQHQTLPLMISLGEVAELRRIDIDDKRVVIGAAASLNACRERLVDIIPAFSQLLERFASQPVRNQGTAGGNLANASPIGDIAPLLLALDATLLLRCGETQRRLPLDDFFLSYRKTALQAGEFIEAITVPLVTVSPLFTAWKVSKRHEDDISTVSAAFNIHIAEGVITAARLAFGGMAAVPARALNAEAALIGQPFTRKSLDAAGRALSLDFQPLTDFRGSGAYRLAVAQNLLRRFYLQQTQPAALEVFDYVY
ncbi:xanthine dehydrogenase small subunit [Franconibacter pulveris]|uniref:xanthine dehydrogenase small subunit n=1 Tax=Franconibacter pulveris TaxID=435910 RepID=UPI0004963507|nr:xanthine dehydrogenase small subunit [Franconibacter pulveris]